MPGSSPAAGRRTSILEMLQTKGSVSVTEAMERFAVSAMTARRDLAELVRQGVAIRTHGGIVAPRAGPPEVSFGERLDVDAAAKQALARTAAAMLGARETLYLDSSTTSYFLAARLLELGTRATLLTNSLPIIQLVAGHAPPGLDLVAVGGALRSLTQSFVGPEALQTVCDHFADRAFLSINGLTADGWLGEADPLEAEIKRAMIAQAAETILLIDRSKLRQRAAHPVAPVAGMDLVLAHGVHGPDLRALRPGRGRLRLVQGP